MTLSGESEQVRRDWQQLGSEDPLWAVLMKPGTKNGGWDPADFLAEGRAEVDPAMAHLTALGVDVTGGRALDFGCGAGRLSQALAGHMASVVGVDAAPAMLEAARRLDVEHRCEFVLNERDDLSAFADGSFDLTYSSLVLQHLPPALGRVFLGELARVTRSGGAIVVQVTTEPLWNAKGVAFRYLPWPLLKWGQRRILGYPAPMRMRAFPANEVREVLDRAGADVLDRVEDTTYGGHWRYHRYFARKR